MESQQLLLEYHQLCDYGCGRIARFTFKNGKHCCESAMSKCPATRKRLRETSKENIAKWHANGETCRHHQSKRKNRDWIDNHGKCDNPGCTNFNDGTYGSGRFCSERCAYQFTYYGKRRKGKKTKKQLAHLEKIHKLRKVHAGGWKCKVCGEVFDTQENRKQHLRKIHGLMTAKKLESEAFECPYCHTIWPTRQKLGGHAANCKFHPKKALHDEGHHKATKKIREGYANGTIIPVWLGRKHSTKTKELISQKTTLRRMTSNHNGNIVRTHHYQAKTCDGNSFLVQGTWEMNVANRLYELGIPWENKTRLKYQADITRHYRPDMTLKDRPNTYIEVKGYFSDQDREKMKNVLLSNPQATIYFLHLEDYHKFVEHKIALEECLILTLNNIKEIPAK